MRFWEAAWQAILFGTATARLERLIAAGFDGVYLDRADVHAHWSGERPSARADMSALIERLSEHAKRLSPGFLVVMQNAEELLTRQPLRAALDGMAKEDLLFGVEITGQPNSDAEIRSSIGLLKRAQADGLPIFVVEYLDAAPPIAKARRRLRAERFVPTFARRELDQLGEE